VEYIIQINTNSITTKISIQMTTISLCANLTFTVIAVVLLVISIAFAIPAQTLPDWFTASYGTFNFGAFQVCSKSRSYSSPMCESFNCYSFYDFSTSLSFSKSNCARLGASRALIMIGLLLNFLSIAPIILLVFLRKPSYRLLCRSASLIPLTISSISLIAPMGLIPSVSREIGGSLGVGYILATVSGCLTIVATILFASFTIYCVQLEKSTPTSTMNTSLIESSYPNSSQYQQPQGHYGQPQANYGQPNYPRANQIQPQAYNTFNSYPPQSYPQYNPASHPQYAVVATPIQPQQSQHTTHQYQDNQSQPITHQYRDNQTQPQSPQQIAQ
jgi:hypothetical protein